MIDIKIPCPVIVRSISFPEETKLKERNKKREKKIALIFSQSMSCPSHQCGQSESVGAAGK